MKKYRVEYERTARKAIDKLDKPIRTRIMDYINTNLVDCENPRFKGANLTEYPNANWRYRVGKYRIIDVDKRNDVYK
ncbi:MAG: type II toxin-antitoxin system mRNA interferase toxin, RelE/StbE family [Selenomonadaceae bacterium]|nr:type II toxin-antitoxin system mRNA interferase toxin, RelE/StbE family [Selenomonadaceae bacterium]